MNGKLVVIEGLDGSGKSTQFALLEQWLQENKTPVKAISFPDYNDPSSSLVKLYLSGAFGDSPDAVNAYAASSFYAVDRYASYKRYWQAEYEQGAVILAARYVTSNAIHQMSKLPPEQWDSYLDWLEDYEYRRLELPKPDAVVFLDMPLEIAQTLLLGRYGGDERKKDIHEQDVAYLKQCRKAAEYAAKRWGWMVVPCGENGAPFSVEAIHQAIIQQTGDKGIW